MSHLVEEWGGRMSHLVEREGERISQLIERESGRISHLVEEWVEECLTGSREKVEKYPNIFGEGMWMSVTDKQNYIIDKLIIIISYLKLYNNI